MFTIAKKQIYIDNKKQNEIKKIELITWVNPGRDTCQIIANNSRFQTGHVFSCKARDIYI